MFHDFYFCSCLRSHWTKLNVVSASYIVTQVTDGIWLQERQNIRVTGVEILPTNKFEFASVYVFERKREGLNMNLVTMGKRSDHQAITTAVCHREILYAKLGVWKLPDIFQILYFSLNSFQLNLFCCECITKFILCKKLESMIWHWRRWREMIWKKRWESGSWRTYLLSGQRAWVVGPISWDPIAILFLFKIWKNKCSMMLFWNYSHIQDHKVISYI